MSRTYKDRGYRRRIVKNSLYQKMLKCGAKILDTEKKIEI